MQAAGKLETTGDWAKGWKDLGIKLAGVETKSTEPVNA
jgi:hypothetical protein